MCEKISQALRTRAEAIRPALEQYNSAASQLNPPRVRLTWHSVIDSVALADFDLLRDTTTDIRTLAWANPANRDAMVLYFAIKRAKEEIRRLNVEIRRTLTFMMDDHVDYLRAIRANLMGAPHLAHELAEQWRERTAINTSIAARFRQTGHLKGFSGSLFPGLRIGRDESINDSEELPLWAAQELGIMRAVVEYEESETPPASDAAPQRADDEDLARETDGVEDLVVDLMECLYTLDVRELE